MLDPRFIPESTKSGLYFSIPNLEQSHGEPSTIYPSKYFPLAN